MTTWHRGLDNQGRLFTFAVTGESVAIYYPDISDLDMVVRVDAGGHAQTTSYGGLPVKHWRDDTDLAGLENFKRSHRIVGQVDASTMPGQFFPRCHRGPEHPPIDVAARTATMRVARSLFARLREIFQVVEPTPAHDLVFGHELRQLLILACTEVESSWRAILSANMYPPGRWGTNDYVKLLEPMKLDSYTLRLATHPEYGEITPFDGWSIDQPTRSLVWYDAYNATKHNREGELHRATVHEVITAMAAVHVMTVAQFGFDEVERSHFHPDEFNFERSWRWLGDSYIRPLLLPDQPRVVDGRYAPWPTEWTQGPCPF